MSLATNIPINSRTLSGVILISDGIATLENGDLNCDDIIASTVDTIKLIVRGEFRSNTNGIYTIPTSISSEYGSLISYGNLSGNGSTDFTNFQSTYTATKGGFYFWNKSSTVALTNLAIIDNSQTYFKSQLIGCTCENPVGALSVVNRQYVQNNFVDKANNITENINGLKTFTNNLTITTALRPSLILQQSATEFTNIRQNGGALDFQNLSTAGAGTNFLFSGSSVFSVSQSFITVASATILQLRQLKAIAGDTANAQTIYDNMTGGSITMGGTATTNSIRGNTTFTQNVSINGTGVIGSTLSIGGTLTLTGSSYTFPLASNLVLGYYYKDAGFGNFVANITPKSIHNTPTIPVGVWRIDFSVETYCNIAGGAGQQMNTAQTYISTTPNTAMTTAVPHTGAKVYSTVQKIYQPNEYELMVSSFTYNQTTAGILYLNLVRIYVGDFTFTGEIAYTRIG